MERACRRGEIGCVQCKKQLIKHLNAYLEPIYEKRKVLEGQRDYIIDLLREGAKQAKEIAVNTMEQVFALVGFKL